jgi:hypothetical protein
MVHEGGRHFFGVRFVGHLQVQDLEHRGAAQVEAERLAGRLDVSDHFAAFLSDVDQRLLRELQKRRERRAEERPQPRGRRRGLAQADVRRAVHLFDAG